MLQRPKPSLPFALAVLFCAPALAQEYGTVDSPPKPEPGSPMFLSPQFRDWLQRKLSPDLGLVGQAEASAPKSDGAGAKPQLPNQPLESRAPPAKAPTLVTRQKPLAHGLAAWYQHPGTTASGESYNPDYFTAAHRTLPFGTRLKVVNEANGKAVVVRVNDRISKKALERKLLAIELSRRSAEEIGITGVSRVTLFRSD